MRTSGTLSGCHGFDTFPCCHDDASAYACLENRAFVEYMQCHVSSLMSSNCSVSELSCSGIGSTASGGSSRATSSGEPRSVGATRLARTMKGEGFIRVLVSVVRVLTVTTTVKRLDEVSLTNHGSDCLAKYSTCRESDVCWSCNTNYDTSEYQQCLEAARYAKRSSGTSSDCHEFDMFPCGRDDGSEHACVENDALRKYMQCQLQSLVPSDCPVRELTCSDIGRSASTSNSRGASTSESSTVGATSPARNMAGDGYLRLLVSGIRTLTATSAVEQMHEDSPMKSTSDCLEKLAACQDDDVCGSCITNYDSPEYQQRIESARNAIHTLFWHFIRLPRL